MSASEGGGVQALGSALVQCHLCQLLGVGDTLTEVSETREELCLLGVFCTHQSASRELTCPGWSLLELSWTWRDLLWTYKKSGDAFE